MLLASSFYLWLAVKALLLKVKTMAGYWGPSSNCCYSIKLVGSNVRNSIADKKLRNYNYISEKE